MSKPRAFFIREALGVALVAGTLLGAGGDLAWWPAWTIVALTGTWVLGTALIVSFVHPDLVAERLRPKPGSAAWDQRLMAAYGQLQLALLLLAGLDHRWGWSEASSLGFVVGSLVMAAAGHGLVLWANASNAFFSKIVRVQLDRDHSVVRTGPYAFVRHPAYTGTILTSVATPIALSSVAAVPVGLAAVALMLLRTHWEDRTLRAELDGYTGYAKTVRFRLIPGLW